jgi:hypothetical protein
MRLLIYLMIEIILVSSSFAGMTAIKRLKEGIVIFGCPH